MIYLQNVRYVGVYKPPKLNLLPVLVLTICFMAMFSLSNYCMANVKKLMDSIETSVVITSEVAMEKDQLQKMEIRLLPEIEIDLPKQSQLTAIARIRANADETLVASQQTDVELRELIFQTDLGRTFLTLGKQQVVWGKADGLKVLDVVNPQDFREFILDDFDNARIPLWIANAEVPIAEVTLQFLWIPDQRYHKFAPKNGAYGFSSSTQLTKVPTGAIVELQETIKPDSRIKDADWGMRLSSFWKGWDLTLNYLYHYNDTPVFFRGLSTTDDGIKVTIGPRYERSHLVGGTFSNAFGDLTLRGELGYSTNRYISTNNLSDIDGVVNNNELAYVVGLDWYGLSDSLISAQLFQTYLSNYRRQLIRDEINTTFTVLIKQDFINDTLNSELLWLHNANREDGLVRPKLSYALNDEIRLWLAADIFYGNENGLFGQFDGRDRIISGVEISL